MTVTVGRDSTEVVVAAQWNRVLGRFPASIDDNFFENGGNSLKAARLAGGLRKAVGREVPLHVIFDLPTVRAQSDWLRTRRAGGADAVMTLKPNGGGAPLVLLPGGGGSLVGLGAFADARFDRPVHGLHARGLAAGEVPATGMAELSGEFASMLDADGLPRRIHLAGYCSGGVFAYDLASVLARSGWEVLSVTLLNSTLAVPDVPHEEIVLQRLRQLAGSAGTAFGAGAGPATADELFLQLRTSGQDLLEQDSAAFRRRLDVHAALWRVIADYRPRSTTIPVALFSLPGRFDRDLAEAVGASDWDELGFADFRQIDVADPGMPLVAHEPTLDAVEAWLRDVEGRP
ncbi:phosphopantetheine-binding protein [Streptomyces sp. NPDC048352]|uniref:phosphopantetheine-binding protein n=1 Tax=Streptomyces sp. NPDC048352 TaxID=3154718 RepID=UPI0034145558